MKRKIFICICGFVLILGAVASSALFKLQYINDFQILNIASLDEKQNSILYSNSSLTSQTVELGIYYSETQYGQLEKVISQNNEFSFPYSNDSKIELWVESDLQDSDIVRFFYCKNDDYKYVEISNINNLREIDITSILTSVGTYQFFAVLNGDLSGENINIYKINIQKSADVEFNPTITYEEIIGNPGEINKYKLTLQNLGQTGYDVDELTILWYIVEDNNEYLSAIGNGALYTPLTQGRFTVRANVMLNGVSILEQISRPEIEILARANNSANVLMYVLIVVGVLSIGLVVSIVIKVKSEKVW